jgi:hypothetical protein
MSSYIRKISAPLMIYGCCIKRNELDFPPLLEGIILYGKPAAAAGGQRGI